MNQIEVATMLALQEENVRLKSEDELGELWQVHELARRYKVSETQIRRWIKTGKLTAFQLAGEPNPRHTRVTEAEREIFELACEEFSLQGGDP